jgi:hypothetical protein
MTTGMNDQEMESAGNGEGWAGGNFFHQHAPGYGAYDLTSRRLPLFLGARAMPTPVITVKSMEIEREVTTKSNYCK